VVNGMSGGNDYVVSFSDTIGLLLYSLPRAKRRHSCTFDNPIEQSRSTKLVSFSPVQ